MRSTVALLVFLLFLSSCQTQPAAPTPRPVPRPAPTSLPTAQASLSDCHEIMTGKSITLFGDRNGSSHVIAYINRSEKTINFLRVNMAPGANVEMAAPPGEENTDVTAYTTSCNKDNVSEVVSKDFPGFAIKWLEEEFNYPQDLPKYEVPTQVAPLDT